ncbi:MAG TPA: ribosomal protein S18-alanine N-acetyltransferase [Fimbriimonadaceae bacterium]|nr:ribosomal protein S18-alanine N-acetyltransferase [Fimbriimonadaceae bacterium]
MNGLRLVPLHRDHIPQILEIEKASNGAPWSEQSFLNELENPQSIFLVGVIGNRVAGYGGVWICIDEAHVTNVAVAEEDRRKGVGKSIVKELLDKSVDSGATCSTLEVRAGNHPAIQMYKSFGFVPVATRKRYYPDNHEDAVVMWLYDLK